MTNMAMPRAGGSRAVSGTSRVLPFPPRGIAVNSGCSSASILRLRADRRSPVQSAAGTTGKLHLSASQLTFSPFPPAFLLPLFLCRVFSPQKCRGSTVRRHRGEEGGAIKNPVPLPSTSSDEPSPRRRGEQEGEILSLGGSNCHQDRSLPSPLRDRPRARRCRGLGSALPRGRRRCPAAPVLLSPRLRAAPEPEPEPERGARSSPSPLLTPQPRFIPGAGRSLPAPAPASGCALVPAPRRILRGGGGGEARSAEPPPSRGVPAAERDGEGWGRGRGRRGGPLLPPPPSASSPPKGAARQTGEQSATSGGRRGGLRETRLPASYSGETTGFWNTGWRGARDLETKRFYSCHPAAGSE